MNYGSLNLKELKAELRLRGARISGRKVDLIERLEAYDRNQDFGRDQCMEDEFDMDIPPLNTYTDINSDTTFPVLAFAAITFYLEVFKKKIGSTAKNRYYCRFLRYFRVSEYDSLYSVRSECRAEMKKHCTYKVDVSVDQHGSIVEGQCECAAGQGPVGHCKHICAVLYALHKFTTAYEIITEETCTQRLQTFHKCKPYTGSPIKACSISLSNAELQVNFEARPPKYKKQQGYAEHFRSTWLNHPDLNSYPVSQLFSPANAYAVNTDHDYQELQCEDIWLQYQKIMNVSEKDIHDIEVATRGHAKNKEWKDQHSRRITSSSFGKICHATEKTDFSKLARTLTNPLEDIQTPPLRHGRKYESFAIRKFEHISHRRTAKCGMFVSHEHPYLAASPDALLGTDELVEVKCPYTARDRQITEVTVPYLKRVDQKLKLDENKDYYYQIQGQLYCTGRQTCHFVVYTFKDIQCITVERDNEFIARMLNTLKNFYGQYFKKSVLDKFYYKDYYKYSFE